MGENLKVKGSRDLQNEIESLAADKTRDEISEIIEGMKTPRKAINEFVVKHSEFVKALSSPEAIEAVKICGGVVAEERTKLLSLSHQLLTGLEHLRWLTDERISMLRRQEALAKDKYGNERKPLELSPEEQELAYDLRGAAMRNSYEQTTAIQRELEVTQKLQQVRQEVYHLANQPLNSLSKSSTCKLISWYKRQLASADKRAQEAERKLSTYEEEKGLKPLKTCSSAPTPRVGPADVKLLKEKLNASNRELDYLRNRLVDTERKLIFSKQKVRGSEDVMDRLAKITDRERQKSARLDRELQRVTELALSHYEVEHRRLPKAPDSLPTTAGEVTLPKKY